MQCNEALPRLHEYLDGDLQPSAVPELQAHLEECRSCAKRLRALEQTEAIVRTLQEPPAPGRLSERIMGSLPLPPRRRTWVNWVRRHPAATAAAVFLVVMLASVMSAWDQGTELSVRGEDLEGIVIDGHHVLVPAAAVLDGDLVVENGTVQVDGDLRGNLVVIDGHVALASTAHIAGRVTEVDRALDWVWYRIGEWASAMTGAK